MELLCGLLGKAPLFGLMTDEGRMANWLVDVKTTEEPGWGVLGTAIGLKVIDGVPFIAGIGQYIGKEVTNDNMHLLKKMGSTTAASGAVGLYHVENLTPDAKEKGRKLLKDGYQTYVYDDAEQARVLAGFPVEWEGRPKKPTVGLIGCPHNTYHEILWWGKKITEALEKKGLEKTAVPVKLFCSHVVRDHLVEDEPVLVGKMKKAGMNFTNMCTVSYAGMKGFSDRVFGVTNSPRRATTIPPCVTSRTLPSSRQSARVISRRAHRKLNCGCRRDACNTTGQTNIHPYKNNYDCRNQWLRKHSKDVRCFPATSKGKYSLQNHPSTRRVPTSRTCLAEIPKLLPAPIPTTRSFTRKNWAARLSVPRRPLGPRWAGLR